MSNYEYKSFLIETDPESQGGLDPSMKFWSAMPMMVGSWFLY